MMKKMKSVTAFVLACVMVFCALPVFAAEIGDTVTWYNFGEYEVVYKGELQEGKTTFGTEVKPFYCTFDAKYHNTSKHKCSNRFHFLHHT